MVRLSSSLFCALLAFSLAVRAEPEAVGLGHVTPGSGARPNSVAIFETVAQGVPEAMAGTVNEKLVDYITNALRLDAISKTDIRNLVSFQQAQQLTGCEAECSQAADLGRLLGVERIVTSTLGRLGDRFQLSVVAMDVATGRVLGRGTRELRAEQELVESARDLAHYALTGLARESMGYARLEVPVSGASIIIDGTLAGRSPLVTPFRLLAGRHSVRVEREGFIPFEGAVEVEAGQETLVEVRLISKTDIKVAGNGFLPWAGATAGAALLAGGLSAWSYFSGKTIYDEQYRANSVTKAQLDKAREDVDFRVNTLHYYSAWGAGALGGLSAVLFSAYYLSGLGAGGDEPSEKAPAVTLEPAADGFRLRF